VSSARPASAWRAVRLMALALLAAAGSVIGLIGAGAFDPLPGSPPAGTAAPGHRSLSGRGEALYPQPVASPLPEHYWLRLRANWQEGELDSGYGLRLGDESNGLTVAVSPLGYAAVWGTGPEGTVKFLPWQTWPHVHTGQTVNEIWLEVAQQDDRAEVSAWVNRELLWRGDIASPAPGAALWLSSFGGPLTVDFRGLDWWGE